MSEKTAKDRIYYPHAVISFISYRKNTSLLLSFIVHSEHIILCTILAVICYFSVPSRVDVSPVSVPSDVNTQMTSTTDMERIRDPVAFLFMHIQGCCKGESHILRAAVYQGRRGHMIIHFFPGTLLLALIKDLVWKGFALLAGVCVQQNLVHKIFPLIKFLFAYLFGILYHYLLLLTPLKRVRKQTVFQV